MKDVNVKSIDRNPKTIIAVSQPDKIAVFRMALYPANRMEVHKIVISIPVMFVMCRFFEKNLNKLKSLNALM